MKTKYSNASVSGGGRIERIETKKKKSLVVICVDSLVYLLDDLICTSLLELLQ